MENKFFNLLFFSFLIIGKIYSIIVVPFALSKPEEDFVKKNYSIKDFFTDYYKIDLYSSINIGHSNLRILARISTDNNTFFLSEEECKRNSSYNVQRYDIISRSGYQLMQSSSYKNISLLNNSLTNYKNGGIISDTFLLYNTTKLSCQPLTFSNYMDKEIDNKVNLTDMRIIIEEYTQNKICAVLGIGNPYKEVKEGIIFINELKRKKAINDYSFTFEYITNSDGQLIIGGLPHEYHNNSKTYMKNQYVKINSYSPNDYIHPWSILFNKIYISDDDNNIINIQENVKSIIVPNLGFIIGNIKYKNFIYKNFFKSLINKGICKIDKINSELLDLKNEEYEIFSCDKDLFINLRSSFPKINFEQKDVNYIFFFSFFDLYDEIQGKYYFLIIFPVESNSKNNNWYIGIPFLKRYQFVFNYDSKSIGFYNDKINDKKDIKNDTNNENININNNSNIRLIIEISVVIFLVGIIILSFIIGKKLNDKRKKRANELNDDNYEYFTKENKEKNDLNIGI